MIPEAMTETDQLETSAPSPTGAVFATNGSDGGPAGPAAGRRALLVHAHPDDEVTGTGVTMAKLVAEGARVTLVTCTLGEEGEVVVPELAHLASDADDQLGPYRIGELDRAMAELGVTDYLRLGGDGKYRDSGMAYDEGRGVIPLDTLHEDCFWDADLLTAATDLVPVIRDRRPHVLITYDEYGGYGHPDHIKAHRVAMYAQQLAGAPSFRPDLGAAWQVPRVLWTAMAEGRMREGLRKMLAAGVEGLWGGDIDPEGPLPPMVKPDSAIAAVVNAPEHVAAKLAAFRAHRTQIPADSAFFTMADVLGDEAWAEEAYLFAAGEPFPAGTGERAVAGDLFAGLAHDNAGSGNGAGQRR